MPNVFNPSYVGLRQDLLRHIQGRNLNVLDIGCATGANGRYLRDEGIAGYVEGLEIDPAMAAQAQTAYDRVIVGDIESPEVFGQLSPTPFDYILIGDVLEHLRDPWQVLRLLTGKLQPDGKIIFSVPNSGHIDVFIHLFIKGYWPYNERGIFDKTHLRLFTKRNVLDLVRQAGLTLEKLDRNFRFRDRIGSRFPPHGFLLKAVFPNLYTFQFIAVCRLPQAST